MDCVWIDNVVWDSESTNNPPELESDYENLIEIDEYVNGYNDAKVIFDVMTGMDFDDIDWGDDDPFCLVDDEGEEDEEDYDYDDEGDDYDYWPYPAANVAIPKNVTHIPGTATGERCLVINTSKVRFLEKPSAKSRALCYNVASTASVYHIQFINMNKKPRKDDFGLAAEWDPMTLPRGTKIPYKGKSGNYYKTEINGYTLYIPAKQARLK